LPSAGVAAVPGPGAGTGSALEFDPEPEPLPGPAASATGSAARSPPWQLSSMPLPGFSFAFGLTSALPSSQSGPRKKAE
jgi:hypothetical protein